MKTQDVHDVFVHCTPTHCMVGVHDNAGHEQEIDRFYAYEANDADTFAARLATRLGVHVEHDETEPPPLV